MEKVKGKLIIKLMFRIIALPIISRKDSDEDFLKEFRAIFSEAKKNEIVQV